MMEGCLSQLHAKFFRKAIMNMLHNVQGRVKQIVGSSLKDLPKLR